MVLDLSLRFTSSSPLDFPLLEFVGVENRWSCCRSTSGTLLFAPFFSRGISLGRVALWPGACFLTTRVPEGVAAEGRTRAVASDAAAREVLSTHVRRDAAWTCANAVVGRAPLESLCRERADNVFDLSERNLAW